MPKVETYTKNWVFRANDVEDKFESWKPYEKYFQYIFVGPTEAAPSTGGLHYHGYIQFKQRKRKPWILKHIRTGVWYDPAGGSLEQNKKYSDKPDNGDDWYEYGEYIGERERTDLKWLRDIVLADGADIGTIMRGLSNVQHQRFAKTLWDYRKVRRPRPEGPVVVRWYYGPSNCSKSWTARNVTFKDVPKDDVYVADAEGGFLMGYQGENYVIFDDFEVGYLPYKKLLKMTQEYQDQRVRVHYGWEHWRPKEIIFTAIQSPTEMFADTEREPVFQIVRRLDYIDHFTTPYNGGNAKKTVYTTH